MEVVDAAAEYAERNVDEPGLDEERRQPASQALDDRTCARAVSLGEAPDGGLQGRREVFAQDGAAVWRAQAGCLGLPFVEHDLDGAVASGRQRRTRERRARGVSHLHFQVRRVGLREVDVGAADHEGEAAVGVGAGPARERPPPVTSQLDPRPAQPLAGTRDDTPDDLETTQTGLNVTPGGALRSTASPSGPGTRSALAWKHRRAARAAAAAEAADTLGEPAGFTRSRLDRACANSARA